MASSWIMLSMHQELDLSQLFFPLNIRFPVFSSPYKQINGLRQRERKSYLPLVSPDFWPQSTLELERDTVYHTVLQDPLRFIWFIGVFKKTVSFTLFFFHESHRFWQTAHRRLRVTLEVHLWALWFTLQPCRGLISMLQQSKHKNRFILKNWRFSLLLERTCFGENTGGHECYLCSQHMYLSSQVGTWGEDLVTSAAQHDVKPNLKAFPMLIIEQSVLSAGGLTHLFHT